ncbi:MAG: hypothetical protein KME16_27650 [Scytolyngbya sp. HA4215-MV1]|nr:hypothetical protein [Scytolyngbya sp. HA4215-MV1]
MERKWILYDKEDRQVAWPTCINNLSPIENVLGTEMPPWMKDAFNRRDIFNEDEMFVPIHSISVLEKCSTDQYIDCPNIPKHHLENAKRYAKEYGGNSSQYLKRIGRYYWLDFDLIGLDEEF